MLHEILDMNQQTAIKEAVEAMEKCYYAMNTLSVVTRVNFSFAGTDLLDAWKLCQRWLEKIEQKKKEVK